MIQAYKTGVCGLALALLLCGAQPAAAVDFKARGQWVWDLEYGRNGNFTGGNGHTGFTSGDDPFETSQRIRMQLDAAASEALSGTVYFEIGNQYWGRASQGAAMGADGNVVEVKNAYLDWTIPRTALSIRMGLQNITLPSFTSTSQIMSADMAAVTAAYTVNDNVSLTAFWLRPWNDNYKGDAGKQANYLDNFDMFGISAPLSFDGLRVTPWVLYGMLGRNVFRDDSRTDNPFLPAPGSYYTSNLYPLYGSMSNEALHGYGNVWWGGLTGEATAFHPLRIAWDFNYGSVRRNDASSNRQGWLASLVLEYARDWGVPGLHAWYASGDDANPDNGSERLPYTNLDDGGIRSFGTFAFGGGRPNTTRDARIAHSMAGTWGVGLTLTGVSFFEDLTHAVRLNLIGGTNDPALLPALQRRTGIWMAPNETALGKEGLYLTRNDTALEINLNNDFKLYENLKIALDAAYIHLWLDTSANVWGQSRMNGVSDSVHDAWLLSCTVIYSF